MGHVRFDPRRFQLLSDLTEPQALMVRRLARLIRVPRRHPIYRCGESSDRLFFVQAGVVKTAAALPGNREVFLTLLHPGDVFGELAVIEDGPRDHRAEAHEDALVWAVNRRVFLEMVNESPALGTALARLMARRARDLRMRLEELLCQDAHTRVAHALLDLAAKCAVTDAEGLLIPIRLTQADLANMTGLTRETVNAVLGDMRAENLVESNRCSIRIKRPNALHSAGAIAQLRSRQSLEPALHAPRFRDRLAVAADSARV